MKIRSIFLSIFTSYSTLPLNLCTFSNEINHTTLTDQFFTHHTLERAMKHNAMTVKKSIYLIESIVHLFEYIYFNPTTILILTTLRI